MIGKLDDFRTSHAVNEVLGKLLILVAQNRIPLRNANALSYICQLLLASTTGVRGELHLKSASEELRVLNRTTDLMWGKDDDGEADNDNDDGAEEADAEDEVQESEKPNTLDAAVKLLAGS